MEEARKTSHKKIRGAASSKTTAVTPSSVSPAPSNPTRPVVGATMSQEELAQANERVKNMSDFDMNQMSAQMQNMSPEQEARMKSMGVDPVMMKRVSAMMNS